MSMACLVLGVLSFCMGPLTMIPATILGVVSLVKSKKKPRSVKGAGFAIAGMSLGIVSVPFWVVLPGVARLARAREESRRAVCARNLRQIGLGIAMYSNDYDGWYPAGRKTSLGSLCLLFGSYVSARKIFKCPGTRDDPSGLRGGMAPARRPTPKPHQCSYDYVPLNSKAPLRTIIAFDKSADNHGGEGRNVLSFDRDRHSAHVKWMSEDEFQLEFQKQAGLRKEYGVSGE